MYRYWGSLLNLINVEQIIWQKIERSVKPSTLTFLEEQAAYFAYGKYPILVIDEVNHVKKIKFANNIGHSDHFDDSHIGI